MKELELKKSIIALGAQEWEHEGPYSCIVTTKHMLTRGIIARAESPLLARHIALACPHNVSILINERDLLRRKVVELSERLTKLHHLEVSLGIDATALQDAPDEDSDVEHSGD